MGCLLFTKKFQVISVGMWMVRLSCFARTERFQKNRNVLKGNPKFPIGISERKMCLPFAFIYQLVLGLSPVLTPKRGYWAQFLALRVHSGKLNTPNLFCNFRSEGFAYYLPNRFPCVIVKQLLCAWSLVDLMFTLSEKTNKLLITTSFSCPFLTR